MRTRITVRSAGLRAVSLLAGVIAAGCIGELGLRLVGPAWLELRMSELNVPDTRYGFGSDADWPVERVEGRFHRFVPGSAIPVTHYEYSQVAHIDALGARATPSSGRDAAACRRVIFLGDSFTFGIGVSDSATFISLLDLNPGVCLVNLGVPGSSFPSQIDIVARRHRELGCPSLYVLVMFAGNDILEAVRDDASALRNPSMPATAARPAPSRIDEALRIVNDYAYHNRLLKRSYLLQFVRSGLLLVRNKLASRPEMYQLFQSAIPDANFRRRAAASLDAELSRLAILSTGHGFQVLFIMIPDVYQVYDELRRTKLAQYHLSDANLDVGFPSSLLEEKVSQHGYPFVDALACLRGGGPGLYYTQDTHLTARGHEVVASCVADAVNGAIERSLQVSPQPCD